MDMLQEKTIHCPYCGENLEVLLDQQEAGHQYIEDCQVCCQPIVFNVESDPRGELTVNVQTENDAY